MAVTPHLLSLLLEETPSFTQAVDMRWRPTNLLYEIQKKELLTDMIGKVQRLREGATELQQLERSDLYIKLLRRLEFIIKRANFLRRGNDLAFIQAVSEFYTNFAEVLRRLKLDQAKGQLHPG